MLLSFTLFTVQAGGQDLDHDQQDTGEPDGQPIQTVDEVSLIHL